MKEKRMLVPYALTIVYPVIPEGGKPLFFRFPGTKIFGVHPSNEEMFLEIVSRKEEAVPFKVKDYPNVV